MSKSANAAVAQQYEKWVYPFPIQDLSTPEVRAKWDGGDYERNWLTFFPNKEFRNDIDVLVAGCGSNAAARYAFNHPPARVTGIDLSATSLAHENFLKEKHGLNNLSLHQMRIEEVASLGKTFDFIDCSGVLHHLPDPVAGLRALGSVLKPEGTIAIMVYGQYGRTGVYMLQEMFRLMGLGQSEEDVAMVKQTLAALPKSHAVQGYVERSRDTKYDAGLVDSFLHRQDRAYTVQQCVDFAKDAGLSFMHWWDNILYYPEGQLNMDHPFYRKVNTMPDSDIWQFMELYNGTLGQHGFCVCRPDRPESGYRADFSGDAFMNYIPVSRCREVPRRTDRPGVIGVKREPHPVYNLDEASAKLFRQIDGKKTIRECFAASELTGDAVEQCRAAFRHLWRLSYIFVKLP